MGLRRAFTGRDQALMRQSSRLLELVSNRVPWALARFNDGEVKAMLSSNVGEKTARDDQEINQSLVDKLNWAFNQRFDNLWLGLPCSVCWPSERAYLGGKIEKNYPYQTLAVVQTNRNWDDWITKLPPLLKNRSVVWVSGEDQDLNHLKSKVGIVARDHWKLPTTNVWQSEYEKLSEKYDEFETGDIVFLSCGPMATVLAVEWFLRRPDCTFIDIGSTFDPFTRNVWHACHTKDLPRCIGCN